MIIPVASFTSSKVSGPSPLVVTFNSTSPNADRWQWWVSGAFGGGELMFGTGPTARYTFTVPGEYKVVLKVFLLYAESKAFQTIIVESQTPRGTKPIFVPTPSPAPSLPPPVAPPPLVAPSPSSDLAAPAAAWKKYSAGKDTFKR